MKQMKNIFKIKLALDESIGLGGIVLALGATFYSPDIQSSMDQTGRNLASIRSEKIEILEDQIRPLNKTSWEKLGKAKSALKTVDGR